MNLSRLALSILGQYLLVHASSDLPNVADELPTLVDHAIAAGGSPIYLDGQDWSVTNSKLQMSIGAHVPGDIVSDLVRSGKVKDPWWNVTWKEEQFISMWNTGVWDYSHQFPTPQGAPKASDGLLLVFDGIRMGASIHLNGKHLANATDQFQRYVFRLGPDDLESNGRLNVLSVRFGAELLIDCGGRYIYNQVDWAPVMPTSDPFAVDSATGLHRFTFGFGIWKSIYILPLMHGEVAITQFVPHTFYAGKHPTSILTDDSHKGFSIRAHMEILCQHGCSGEFSVLGDWPRARAASRNLSLPAGMHQINFTLPYEETLGVKLWHPHGHGDPTLYNIRASFIPNSSSVRPAATSRRLGFRHVALVTHKETVEVSSKEDKGTGSFTMFFRVNGAAVKARGANKVPMDLLDGRLTAQGHRRLVQSAVDANFNMLRVWGGGIWEPRAFFDAADELGLLLYTDLQFTWGEIRGTHQEKEELAYQLKRVSHHPSIIMWNACNECGGAGLYQDFAMPLVAEFDQSRPIWPASPSTGWGSGVDPSSGLPNGEKLTIQGFGAPESHGPYTFGDPYIFPEQRKAMMPDHNFQGIGGLAAAPMPTGTGEPGWFRSEFGCKSWSSFESMSATLPHDQWSLNSTAAKNRLWLENVGGNFNSSNVIGAYFGNEVLDEWSEYGEIAFKRQLYQSMIAQLLYMKLLIESWRSQNLWGTLFWMFNEIWPTSGWGSIEYGAALPGQVEGGRWKPLHYTLKTSSYADQLSTCNTGGECFVTNDSPFPFEGFVSIRLLNIVNQSSSYLLRNRSLTLEPGAGIVQWFCASGDSRAPNLLLSLSSTPRKLACTTWSDMAAWQKIGCDGNGTNCIVSISIETTAGVKVSSNMLPFVQPKDITIREATVEYVVGEIIGQEVSIYLSTSAIALYVVLTTQAAGRFSENAFFLETQQAYKVSFKSWVPLNASSFALFKSTLRVEHLAENLRCGNKHTVKEGSDAHIWL